MTNLTDSAIQLLDWILDDQWANLNTVLDEGLLIRGEWKAGRLYVHGEELEPEGWAEVEKPWGQLRNPTPKFRWGESSIQNREVAREILAWFLDEREIAIHLDDFAAEVVTEFPQTDFELDFNFEGWRNGSFALWHWIRKD